MESHKSSTNLPTRHTLSTYSWPVCRTVTSPVNIKHTPIQKVSPVRVSRCASRSDLSWRRNNTRNQTSLFQTRQHNETRVFQSFFNLFGLTLGLRKSEIETVANYLFLILVQQLLLLQMIVSNMFSPITHDDHKVNVMIIRNVTVDYILNNHEDFEGWFKVCQDGEDFDISTITVSSSGRRDNRETSLFWDYRWTSKFLKFNTITKSISVYQFPTHFCQLTSVGVTFRATPMLKWWR